MWRVVNTVMEVHESEVVAPLKKVMRRRQKKIYASGDKY